jgi:hypothetical protein
MEHDVGLMNTTSANTPTTRDALISFLKTLPDDVTLEDIMYHLYVQEKILKGLNEIRDGDVIEDEDLDEIVETLS